MVLTLVLARCHTSTHLDVTPFLPPHALCEPVITPVAVPEIRQAPVPPLVKASTVPVGGAEPQGMVRLAAAANSACGAAVTVIVLTRVLVLPQASTNVHVSV